MKIFLMSKMKWFCKFESHYASLPVYTVNSETITKFSRVLLSRKQLFRYFGVELINSDLLHAVDRYRPQAIVWLQQNTNV